MREYNVEIKGEYDLDKINLQIASEEARATEFKSSRISAVGNKTTNIVTFNRLPAGTIPKPLKLVKQGDPQPPETEEIWSGVMVVQGTNMVVTAYRAN